MMVNPGYIFLVFLAVESVVKGQASLLRTTGTLYDYGPGAGDRTAATADDGFEGPITMPIWCHYYNNVVNSVFVNTNGIISFGEGITDYKPQKFPLLDKPALFAVFWVDADPRHGGNLYYRSTNDTTFLHHLTTELKSYFSDINDFHAEWAFVATWDKVTYNGGSEETPRNTIQAVIVANDTTSFAIFLYDTIGWTAVNNGIHAMVGFNAGDGQSSAYNPKSLTADISSIAAGSNVALSGRYAYKIDGKITQPKGSSEVLAYTPKLYDYGSAAGDHALTGIDDGSTGSISIPVAMHYFNNLVNTVFVSTNGLISFGKQDTRSKTSGLPLRDNSAFIAVFWTDIILYFGGTLYYRSITDTTFLHHLTTDLKSYFNDINDFQAQWAFVATWHNVTYFQGSEDTPRNTIQAVLVANEKASFAILSYDTIGWTEGNGRHAMVGFNAGDGLSLAYNPKSLTADISGIATGSNVGHSGRYAYKIDGKIAQAQHSSEELVFTWETIYNYGPTAGDHDSPPNDDAFVGPIATQSLYYNNFVFNRIFVGTNGVISFASGVSDPSLNAFLLDDALAVIAVFWADADFRNGGSLFYRSSSDVALLSRLTHDLKSYFNDNIDFQAEWAFVVTWANVTFYGGSTATPRNTFQAVLVSDHYSSFMILSYETILWPAEDVQVGFKIGEYVNFTITSRSPKTLASTSNVGHPGRHVFKLGTAQPLFNESTEVRLTGSDGTSGRVEVRYAGVWGSVCGDSWDNNAARVICRMLNQTGGIAITQHTVFDQSTGKIWLNKVECSGYENDIASCQHTGWGNHSCGGHHEAAGVICADENPCESQPCGNYGYCKATAEGYLCKCKKGHEGLHCQLSHTKQHLLDISLSDEMIIQTNTLRLFGRLVLTTNISHAWSEGMNLAVCSSSERPTTADETVAQIACQQRLEGLLLVGSEAVIYKKGPSEEEDMVLNGLSCTGSELNLGLCEFTLQDTCPGDLRLGISCHYNM